MTRTHAIRASLLASAAFAVAGAAADDQNEGQQRRRHPAYPPGSRHRSPFPSETRAHGPSPHGRSRVHSVVRRGDASTWVAL